MPYFINNVEEFKRYLEMVFEDKPAIPNFVINYLAYQAKQQTHLRKTLIEQIIVKAPTAQEGRRLRFEPGIEDCLANFMRPVLVTWNQRDKVVDASGLEYW